MMLNTIIIENQNINTCGCIAGRTKFATAPIPERSAQILKIHAGIVRAHTRYISHGE